MYRRDRDNRRRPRRNNTERRSRSALMRPGVQITILLVVALVIVIILQSGGTGNSLPREISVDDAYGKYQNGTYVLDVRTVEEWNEFHAPNSTLIPLDELSTRINELPRDQEIVVVCRSAATASYQLRARGHGPARYQPVLHVYESRARLDLRLYRR